MSRKVNKSKIFDNDFMDDEFVDTGEDFASLLKQYDAPVPKSVKAGQKVKGKVMGIGEEYLFVDIGAKSEAIMARSELLDNMGKLTVNKGDRIEAIVASVKRSEIILSNCLTSNTGKANISELSGAMQNKIPVQGKVTGVNKGGFNIEIMGHRAFCPVSQIDSKFVDDPSVFVNQTLPFMIVQITENGRNIVVSRSPIFEKEIDEKVEMIIKATQDKKVITGTISRIANFGLFVDLGGIDGLVHISEISWDKTEDQLKNYAQGQKIQCLPLKVERPTESQKDIKISLSIKQLDQNPWLSIGEKFKIGDMVDGTITRLMNFGAFVQLLPGIEGLIHISEMRWGAKVNHPSEIVKVGQMVKVNILAINTEKNSISCSLKDAAGDPWASLDKEFYPGALISGTVANKTKFGYFIDFHDGITGLLPFANISSTNKNELKNGDNIQVEVETVDPDKKRISLALGMAEERKDEKDMQNYLAQQNQSLADITGGELGEKLRAALKAKQKED